MEQPSVIVVSYDGLGIGALGPYGNTWVATPVWNELAARGRVFDFVFANGGRLADATDGWWRGRHPLESQDSHPGLPAAFAAAGVPSLLLSDDAALLRKAEAAGWSKQVPLTEKVRSSAAPDLEATAIVRQTQMACAEVAQIQGPFFAWVHLSALGSPWDVPHEFRVKLADEDDPPVPTTIDVPTGEMDAGDHDALWANQLAYAAQMTALDASLGWFVDVIDDLRTRTPVVLAATSPRGFALGAHGGIGFDRDALRSETLHVPLLLDAADDVWAGQRVAEVHDSIVMHHLLREYLPEAVPSPSGVPSARGCVMSVSTSHRAFRTPAWFLREAIGSSKLELFAKPDDRWDVNEISVRCPDVVDQLRAAMDEFQVAADSGTLSDYRLPPETAP